MKIDLGKINQVVCVTADISGENPIYHYAILKQSKGEISFIKMNKRILSIESLVKEIGTRNPVLIHYTGKGILNRKVKREENYRHSILLNARLDDFYFTDYLEDKEVYSSVIRKQVAEDVHTIFTKAKLLVIGISSGPFITAPLAIHFDKSDYKVDEYQLHVEKNLIVSFDKTDDMPFSIKIGNDRVDRELLGAVSLGATYFNPSESLKLNNDEAIYMVNMLEAKQRNIFYRFGMAMMLFFLILLAGNYFYLGSLNKQIEQNYVVLSEHEDQLAQLSLLEEEKNRKENLLRSSGLLSKQFLSYYLMEIAETVPEEITLENINVRPLFNEIKKKQKIEFNDHLIYISGQSKTSELLSRWIDELKKEAWIAKVDIVDYTHVKNKGSFRLEMVLE